MTKDQVVYLRDQLNKDNGKGKPVANSVFYDFDNDMAFRNNGDFVVFDDDKEMVHCISANRNNYVKDETPYSMISTSYEHMQFVEANLTLDGLNSIITDVLNSLLTDEQKQQIKDWALNLPVNPISPVISSYGRHPAPVTEYRPVTIVANPDGTSKGYPVNGGNKGPAPVKSVPADKATDSITSIEAGATLAISGAVDLSEEIAIPEAAEGVTLIGNKDVVVSKKMTIPANDVTIKNMKISNANTVKDNNKESTIDATGSKFTLDSCTWETAGDTRTGIYVNGSEITIRNCTFDGTTDGKLYNLVEPHYGKSEPIKKMVVENCVFKPTASSNNFISLYDFEEGAEVEFNNCVFNPNGLSNPLRISSISGHKATITFNNCRYAPTECTHGSGMVIFQGVKNNKTGVGNLDFSKITVKFNNLRTLDGSKKYTKNNGLEVWTGDSDPVAPADRIYYTYNLEAMPNIIFA